MHVDGLILVLNNCEDRLQLVLGEATSGHDAVQATLLASRELVVPGRTAGFLLPAIADMLAEQERTAGELAGIACTRGPGSFTGIRLALSAAAGIRAGMALESRPGLAGLDYLPLVAATAMDANTGRDVYALTYARRGQVFAQGFGPDGTPLAPVEQVAAADMAARLSGMEKSVVLTGTGLAKNFETFQGLESRHTLLAPAWHHPSSGILLSAAAQAEYTDQDIEPAYGRNADAEDNLDEIARKRGIDTAEAKRILDECRRG